MVSKTQFHLNMALIFAILAFVTYPPNPSHANYLMTWLMSGICIYHGGRFLWALAIFLNHPPKI